MAAKKKQSPESASTTDQKYGALAQELDQILHGIEEGEVDIDDLSDRVERATELIRQCREKLNATQIKVQKVVASLEDAAAEARADDDADAKPWDDEPDDDTDE